MANPSGNVYSVAAATTVVRLGVPEPPPTPVFLTVNQQSTGANAPLSTAGQTLVLSLHGSGNNLTALTGTRIMQAGLNPSSPWGAYQGDTAFLWHEVKGGTIAGNTAMVVWPWDRQPDNGANRRESFWMGWTDGPDAGRLRLYTERRLDALVARLAADPRISATKRVITGGSMGGWGTLSYGIRRPSVFPAIYPDRPRWRFCETAGSVRIPSWAVAITPAYTTGAAPLLTVDDGGYSAATHLDHIAWVADTNKAVPWIGWCVGKNDGYMPFQDHIDAVAALRAAGRGFAFYWNSGDHSTGSQIFQITASYPHGTFELGKGYPVFIEHSLDGNPATDAVGGINVGLSFRNVVETAGTWQCQVTHIASACTVKVKPKSPIYTGNPAPQLVNIPAPNAWVTVSF